MQLTILGAGSSAGTPVVACTCATCTSSHPRNYRTRCSSIVTLDSGEVILIDTGPDLRIQALRESMTRVDAVLYTHTHADHLHGIDDLRAFCQRNRRQIPLYAKQDAVDHIMAKFGYAIREPSHFWDLPVLAIQAVEMPFEIYGQKVIPIPIVHGRIMIYGYRIGNMAYLTDVSEIPETSYPQLQGLELLLIDCLRYGRRIPHIMCSRAWELIAKIGAKQSVMIHMTHELEYETLSGLLPPNVCVGYDGLKLNFS